MSVRVAIVLGLFLLAAAILHGGLYAPGHDFVMNRFTGSYEFVPGDDEGDWSDEARLQRASHGRLCTLTSPDPAGRFVALHRRR